MPLGCAFFLALPLSLAYASTVTDKPRAARVKFWWGVVGILFHHCYNSSAR